jgi:hypothetical protein
VDADGVRIVRSTGSRPDTWLVVLVGAVVIWLAFGRRAPEPPPTAPSDAGVTVADAGPTAGTAGPAVDAGAREASEAAGTRREVRRREIVARRLARKILPRTRGPEGKPEAQAVDAIAALRAAGVTDGIAAFNPPGTDPPRSGVMVPEGVELPEGYLRHHQSTDEGESLPPILLFHPDYEFFDESGAPIVIPDDRVVPPEWVPADIPIDILEPPGDRAARRP